MLIQTSFLPFQEAKPLTKNAYFLLGHFFPVKRFMRYHQLEYIPSNSAHYRPAMPFGNKKQFILEDPFSSVLSQFKKIYIPSLET